MYNDPCLILRVYIETAQVIHDSPPIFLSLYQLYETTQTSFARFVCRFFCGGEVDLLTFCKGKISDHPQFGDRWWGPICVSFLITKIHKTTMFRSSVLTSKHPRRVVEEFEGFWGDAFVSQKSPGDILVPGSQTWPFVDFIANLTCFKGHYVWPGQERVTWISSRVPTFGTCRKC